MSTTDVIGAFSDEQVARITGLSLNQLREWARTGFFVPSFPDGRRRVPYGRIYSFRDLVSLQVLHDLRNEKKISLQHIKDVSERLSDLGDSRWTATTLYVLGKRVVFDNPATKKREEIVSGQRVFNIPLRVVIRNTRRKIGSLNDRSSSLGKFERSRFVSNNEQVFAGTRIPVSSVLDFARAGYGAQRIKREFPSLEDADIAAALREPEAGAAA